MSAVGDPRYLTTLNRIREHSLRADSWARLLRYLGKTEADDEPLHLLTVLDSNGLDDALWCLQAVDGIDRECRLLAVRFARQVQHLMTDPRSINVLDVAAKFANGLATQDELAAAAAAAADATHATRAAVAVAADAAQATWAAAARAAAARAYARFAATWDPAARDAMAAAARSDQEALFRLMLSGAWPAPAGTA